MSIPSLMGNPPLVGRERELAILRKHLDAAITGHGSLVLIGGEAGIGKTALAAALCREAIEQDALILTGKCYDLTETPPYGPWIELFGQYRQKDGLPSLPAAFALPGTVGEVASQAALVQQVLDFFATLAARRLVVVLLDDMHWADAESLGLLRVVARTLPSLSLVLAVTYRSDELPPRHPLAILLLMLVREAAAARIGVRPLHPAEIGMLVQVRHHLPEADADRLVTYLHGRSEGNPFFTGELLRTLEEEGVLRHTNSGWSLDELMGAHVPPLLRQVIDGRLARLSDEAQALLAIAAVIGQDVPLSVWGKVADTDEETLLAVTESAIQAYLVNATALNIRFAHALIREALYEGIAPPRRRGWHLRVAEALAGESPPDPDAVASHFQRACDDRAIVWLVTAGERAQRAYAVQTASDRYEAACALMADAPASMAQRGWLRYRLALLRRIADPLGSIIYLDEAAGLAAASGDRALAAGALFARGFCRANHFSTEEILTELAAGVAALEALSPAELARLNEQDGLPVSTDSKTWRGSLVFHLAMVGHFAEAIAMGESFLARTVPPTSGGALRGFAYGGSHLGLGIAYAMVGDPQRARRAFAEAYAAFRTVGAYHNMAQAIQLDLTLAVLPYDAERIAERRALAMEAERALAQTSDAFFDLYTRFNLVPLLLIEGEWEQARTIVQQAATQFAHGTLRSVASWYLAQIARDEGEPNVALEYISAVLPAGPDTPTGSGRCYVATAMQRLAALLAFDAGDLKTARAWLEAHDRWLAWSGGMLGQSAGRALWAQYYWATGDLALAYARGREALILAAAPRQPLALLAAHRLLGELDTAAGRYADAESHFDTSLALADACAAPFERALTLLSLATLKRATRARAEARALLDTTCAICTSLGARLALDRANALTASLDEDEQPASYPAGLSAREVEVLRLLASGKTNRDIAEALFLSERTIDAHVRNILTKTRSDNRAAATAFAYQQHLA